MSIYYDEIKKEGESLYTLSKYLSNEEFLDTLKNIDLRRIDKVVFTGMGSSLFASYPAMFYLNKYGISSFSIPANMLIYYYRNIITPHTLLILISQSGESIEIKELLEIFKDHALKIGITNTPDSALSKITKVLYLNAGKEKATTSKTYINTLSILLAITEVLLKRKDFDFERISETIDSYLKKEEELINIFYPYFLGTNYITLLGRGPSFSTVLQGALIIKEAAHFYAEGLDTQDFRHGPLDMVGEGFKAIIFSPYDNEKAFKKDIVLAKKIISQKGNLLFVTNKKPDEDFPIFEIKEANPYLLPFFEIIPLQFISCKIAWAKGMDPGVLSNTGKIVLE